MRPLRHFVVLMLLSAPALLHADTTIRSKMSMKVAEGLPPAAAEQMAKAQQAQYPRETVVQLKGDRGYSNTGRTISVMDLTKQQITLIDPEHKLFATVYVKDFPGVIAAATPALPPAAQQFLQTIKPEFSSQKTGKTDTILGIQAEETEWTITLQMPVPPGMPPGREGIKPGDMIPLMKMVLRIWTPLPSEVTRVPALTEYAAHSWKPISADPATSMKQLLPNFPGLSEGLAKMAEEVGKNTGPALRTHLELYMPVLGQLAGMMQGKNQQLLGTYDPSTPFVQSDNEVVEISTNPIDASVFDVPSGYTSTTLPDLLKAMRPAPPPRPANLPLPPAPPAAP